MGEDMANVLEKLKGTVVFLPANQRSKSEGFFPYLYMNRDEKVKLLLNGDNPFENKGLLPFDGKAVEIAGRRKRNGTFAIERISVVESVQMESPQADAEDTSDNNIMR